MEKIYEVREMLGGTPFSPMARPESLVVLWYRDRPLPRKGEFPALHGKHANRSQPMIWDEKASTFTCIECGQVISVSDKLFQNILGLISAEDYLTLNTGDQQVKFALLLDEFPEPTAISSFGMCAVAHEV